MVINTCQDCHLESDERSRVGDGWDDKRFIWVKWQFTVFTVISTLLTPRTSTKLVQSCESALLPDLEFHQSLHISPDKWKFYYIFDLHWLTLNYTITIEQCSTFIDLTSQFLRWVLCYSVLPITGGWRWLVHRHPPRPIVIYSWSWSLVRILPIHLIALYVLTSTVEMLRENAKLVN